MNDYSTTGNYYTIGHIVQFSGLSDRTIRNYISSGILTGEKINGLWHFTKEQVEKFMSHPAVRPSIQAKRNAIVADFLADNKKRTPQSCMILDLPGTDAEKLTEYFNHEIMSGELHDFRFSLDCANSVSRVFLSGRTGELLALVSGFYSAMKGTDSNGTL